MSPVVAGHAIVQHADIEARVVSFLYSGTLEIMMSALSCQLFQIVDLVRNLFLSTCIFLAYNLESSSFSLRMTWTSNSVLDKFWNDGALQV